MTADNPTTPEPDNTLLLVKEGSTMDTPTTQLPNTPTDSTPEPTLQMPTGSQHMPQQTESKPADTQDRDARKSDATEPADHAPHQVWSAQAVANEEPPARGVRLGQLAWGLIVVLCGVFLIAIAFVPANNFALLLIGLVALLGLTLIGVSLVTSLKHRSALKTA